ncbi:glycoside hydrolase family 43 protein [Odoribacter laneus]
MKSKMWFLFVGIFCMPCLVWGSIPDHNASGPVLLGDPFIMLFEGKYYAYGTFAENGIQVLVSEDLKEWEIADVKDGLALRKEDVWGDRWFWAPEVYAVGERFYMYYTAEEQICVAVADSPLGPFRQEGEQPMLTGEKSIDNTLFIDEDGKAYLFFDRFNDGLNIWGAELNEDLQSLRKETMYPCIHVSQEWEEVWPRVNEGAFVIRHKGTYYMTYSANSYESPYYGIGCATAENIKGPWVKYADNPLLQQTAGMVGIGHSALFTDKEGKLRIVFHAHWSAEEIHPRTMHIGYVRFVSQKEGPDKMVIEGPFTDAVYKR